MRLRIGLLWVMECWLVLVMALSAQTQVTIETTNGGPQLMVNGEITPPRMFWGSQGSGKIAIGADWVDTSYEFTPSFAANATFHFRFGKTAGEIWLADFRIIDAESGVEVFPSGSFSTEEGFSGSWNIYPPDESNTVGEVEVIDSSLHVTLTNPPAGSPWPDFHFWSDLTQLPAYKRYRCCFRIRGVPDREVFPAVYHVDGGWTWVGGPPSPFNEEIKLARDAKVNFITFGAPNCWLAPEKDTNWVSLDYLCQQIIAINPQVLLIPRIGLDAPSWWTIKHPEALMVYEDGSYGTKASVSDRQYRAEAAAHLERLCRHLVETFPKNMAGIHPCGQNTGEWFYEGAWGTKLSGYDPATLDAWQAWPRGTSAIPSPAARRSGTQRALLDPVVDRKVIDFNSFLQEEMGDFIATLAAAARRGLGEQKLVLFFYGYHYEFGTVWNSPAASGHYALSRLLKSPDIDILCGPLSYFDRHWLGSGPVMSSAESIAAAGKLWFNEDDTRTYLNTNLEDHARYGGLADLSQTQSVLRRNQGQAALRGLGSWWMDHGAGTGGGWFLDPEIWKVMDQLYPLDQDMLLRKEPFNPEIAAIIDESSVLHLAGGSTVIGRGLLYESRAALGRCGAAYGQYMLEDVLAGNVSAKLQIFLAAWALTPEQRQQLVSSRAFGTTRVWCYAPGYILPEGCNVANMREITGFSHYALEITSARVTPTAVGMAMGIDSAWGPSQSVRPLFAAEADSGEILAVYSNGAPAVTLRRSDQGLDVFVGVPQLTPTLIRVLSRQAGVQLVADDDAVICAAENYLSVHALKDGPLTLKFGNENLVTDALDGSPVGDGPEFDINITAGDTRLFTWVEKLAVATNSSGASTANFLFQNIPNPFNPLTRIYFSLSRREHVTLTLFDVNGRKIAVLLNKELVPGEHSIDFNAAELSTGLYFYQIRTSSLIQTRKMLLIK